MFSTIKTGVKTLKSRSCWRRLKRQWNKTTAGILKLTARFHKRWKTEREGQRKQEENEKSEKKNVRLQKIREDEGYDSWSLGSSASFRSLSRLDSRSNFGSSYSITSEIVKISDSMEILPPNLSGDVRSDTWSLESSAYGSLRLLSRAKNGSIFGSSQSIFSSHSSGFVSLQSIPEPVEHSENKLFKTFKTFLRNIREAW